MTQVDYLRLVHTFEKLFISSKQKRIEQQADGSYNVKHTGLARSHLIEHLQGSKTVGIFSGEVYSKYLCFDVDTGKYSQSQARNDVRVLIYALISEFDISGSVAKLKLYAHLYKTIKANIVLTVKSYVSINYFSFFSINIT